MIRALLIAVGLLFLAYSGAGAQGLQRQCATTNGSNCVPVTVCTSSAAVNVTSGNTTQIVGLTSGQSIRVCSFTITGSAAATAATFVYGTGTNCAGSPSNLTGAMLIGQNGAISSSTAAGSLFAAPASQALCVTAATGNVTGFISYAKY